MKTIKNTKIIGIDHGYGNMKTANHCFKTGISAYDSEPLFTADMLTYNGKHYLIGEGHKEFAPDKVKDEDYYVLTLAAIAKELKTENLTEAHIVIAAGLPLTWTSGQKADFKAYLMKNTEVKFTYKKVDYHLYIQSFCEGEVTPKQAFEIGKETARKMWGDKYQVLVTVHLNTDNVHCHFVVNPVSFKDGAKFKNKIGDHKELRKISDEICREHGLSVLENSEFYSKGKKKEFWAHKAGKKTHRDYLRVDVEYCLSFATSPREFENQLYALGYTLDPVRFSVKAKHWERAVRLSSIGFSKERVNELLRQNAENRYQLFTLEYRPPYKPKKFPLEDELRKLDFSIEHSYDAATVLVDTVFYLVITVIQIVAELADVMLLSPDLRAAEKDLKELIGDYHFLQKHNIHTAADLQANIEQSKSELSTLEHERSGISNRIRRPKSPEEKVENKERRKTVSRQMKPVRERLRRAERILEKSPHLYELLKQEHELEKKARAKYKERGR